MLCRVLYEGRVSTDYDPSALTIAEIRRQLAGRSPLLHPSMPEVTRVRAAVAMITRPAERDVEVLFIRRAPFEGDPWSGDIAFPGGRINAPHEPARAAAERETREEVGIDLERADCLGQLDDVIGGSGAVVVSGFVYALPAAVPLRTNHEVASAGWVPLGVLGHPARQLSRTFRYKDRDLRLPALRVFDDDSPPLWGLTYQFVERFMRLVGREIPAMPWRDSD
jgi:8-oxo-dGTP pyrophosphatase MutT (NUDIX family)